MLRPTLVRAAKQAAPRRLLSTTARAMAAGDTGSGAARPGGERAADAFTRRERSAEEMYIRQEERQKLLALKEKLKAQRKHIDELDKHIDDLTRNQGGEHN